jgi:hypothetical protein
LKEHVTAFESVAEWRHHRQNLDTECLFRQRPDLMTPRLTPKKRQALRFPHDASSVKRYGKYGGGKAALQFQLMMEKDNQPIRVYEEALFVDIESVVPLNGIVLSREDMKYHEAYAIGWIRRSDAIEGAEPVIHYGMDCLSAFFKMLDDWWEEIHANETGVWMTRAENELDKILFRQSKKFVPNVMALAC